MSKFEKRLRKISHSTNNCIILGTAFGYLEQILKNYKTIFVLGEPMPTIKAKNLIYKEEFVDLTSFTEIGSIFIDLEKLNHLDEIKIIWQRNESKVFVQGNDCIERNFSKPFYDTGWGCTSLQGFFHVWEKIK